jgi:zinc/manganese transport system substrate-binding protein
MRFTRRFTIGTVLIIGLCASWSHGASAHAAVRVVTTTTDLEEIARAIGGDRVSVEAICKGAQDPHYVQARPSYMVKLNRADLLVAVGLDLEAGWLPLLIQGARNPGINPGQRGYLDTSAAITPMDVPKGPVDRSQGDVHLLGNPHYWLDPGNAKRVARLIADRLSELDAGGAALYQKNLRALDQRIDQALARWDRAMAPYRGTKVVSYHNTFNYFLHRFGLIAAGYIEERPGIPPAAAHVARLIRRMQSDGVRVIFHESYFDRATSDLVGHRTGARVLLLPTSVGGSISARTFEQLIDQIVSAFVAAMATGTSQ